MRAAFTLLELILVLAVLGFLSAVAAAKLGTLRTGQRMEQAARQVDDQVQRCQRMAASRSEPVRLRLDLDARTTDIRLLGTATERIPPDGQPELTDLGGDTLALSWKAESGATASSGIIDLLFLPDGLCDAPGELTVAQGERSMTVRCHLGSQPPTRLAVAAATP